MYQPSNPRPQPPRPGGHVESNTDQRCPGLVSLSSPFWPTQVSSRKPHSSSGIRNSLPSAPVDFFMTLPGAM